jgi:hypothetical protein
MLIPAQNSNNANCKIQDCFANRQIKEDVKCNRDDSIFFKQAIMSRNLSQFLEAMNDEIKSMKISKI